MEENNSLLGGIRDFFSRDRHILELVRLGYSGREDKKFDSDTVRRYFDLCETGKYTIDDQTWDDLVMDKLFIKLNRTYSSLGQSMLYRMLRNPLMSADKLKQRSKITEFFTENTRIKERMECIMFRLGINQENSFLEMIKEDLVVNKLKYWLYELVGKVLPVGTILLSIFVQPKFLIALLLISFMNTAISMQEAKEIKSSGISYLRDILKAARKLSRIKRPELAEYTDRINEILSQIKDIERGTRFIGFENMMWGVFEPISGALLLEQCSYYGISDKMNDKRDLLMELYGTIGELEALIAVTGYQEKLKGVFARPTFVDKVSVNIVDGVHPLVDKAVPNSLHIDKNDIVLTGTNMSGKSTFLRMLGTNMLLAQTFHFVQATSYEACFFNIVTSISPNDDVTSGKSFFMAEVESIKRIIHALDQGMPVFCPIDELFRGTNPIERISMSAEILLYLNKRQAVCIAATHDRELVDILKDCYSFYYFSERVDNQKGLSFDYKLKTGVSHTRNAIKLLEYCEYPKSITEGAYKRAGSIEGFI